MPVAVSVYSGRLFSQAIFREAEPEMAMESIDPAWVWECGAEIETSCKCKAPRDCLLWSQQKEQLQSPTSIYMVMKTGNLDSICHSRKIPSALLHGRLVCFHVFAHLVFFQHACLKERFVFYKWFLVIWLLWLIWSRYLDFFHWTTFLHTSFL